MYDIRKALYRIFPLILFLLALSLLRSNKTLADSSLEEDAPSQAEVIEVVNELRVANGINPLSVHPVLMQVAQLEANGIANGMGGHWRPNGLTLGQWLIVLGYPLAGDLSLDGYRSENWVAARSVKDAIQAWKGDGEHMNTMLSLDRSDIGVGIAGGDEVIIVLETALQTSSGKMQSAAYPILTQAASSQSGAAVGLLPSQYINPVALSTARPDGDVFHKIQYGQSLWSIAIAYHTTINQVSAWNSIGEERTVYEGQVLLVQRNATQPPPATITPLASQTSFPSDTPGQLSKYQTPTMTLSYQPPANPLSSQAAATDPGEVDAAQFPSTGIRVGLILVVITMGGLMGTWLIQGTK